MYRTDWLEKWEIYLPDKVGLVDADTGRIFTYARMNQIANRLAYFLQHEKGLNKGHRLAVLSQNSAEYVLLFFALAKLGGTLVPLNYRLAPRELSIIIKDCQPSLLIYEQQYKTVLPHL